ALAIRRCHGSLPRLDPLTKVRVVADAPEELEVEREPGRVELHDRADDALEALVDPDVGKARVVADRELDEEIFLRGEVVEDRAAGECDLRFELRDRRPLVAVLREAAARALEDLVAARGPALFGDLRHGLRDRTLQNRTDVLLSRSHGSLGSDRRPEDR